MVEKGEDVGHQVFGVEYQIQPRIMKPIVDRWEFPSGKPMSMPGLFPGRTPKMWRMPPAGRSWTPFLNPKSGPSILGGERGEIIDKKKEEAEIKFTKVLWEDLKVRKRVLSWWTRGAGQGGGGGYGGHGLLSMFGIGGASPYLRFGKRGVYGGLSGLDLLSFLRGGGRRKQGIQMGDEWFGLKSMEKAKAEGMEYLVKRGMGVPLTGAAGASAFKTAKTGVVAGGSLALKMIPVIGAILIMSAFLKRIAENTEAFKYVKNLLSYLVGSLLGVFVVFFEQITQQTSFLTGVTSNISYILAQILASISIIVMGVGRLIHIIGSAFMPGGGRSGTAIEELGKQLYVSAYEFNQEYGLSNKRLIGELASDVADEWLDWTAPVREKLAKLFEDFKASFWSWITNDVFSYFTGDFLPNIFGTQLKLHLPKVGDWKLPKAWDWKLPGILDWKLPPITSWKLPDFTKDLDWSWIKDIPGKLSDAFEKYFLIPAANTMIRLVNILISGYNAIPLAPDIPLISYISTDTSRTRGVSGNVSDS